MNTHRHEFEYLVYDSISELSEADAELIGLARDTTVNAYAPYSNFRVGAAARLKNGQIVTGSNQENASFPAGLCAERSLLAAASSLYPGVAIDTLAISYVPPDGAPVEPISPCGICRQSIQEFSKRTASPIRLALCGNDKRIFIIEDANDLLPLAFTGDRIRS